MSDNSVCADSHMVPYPQRPEELRAGADINMTSQLDPTGDCDLLEEQAIHSDVRIGVHDDPVRMREKKPSA